MKTIFLKKKRGSVDGDAQIKHINIFIKTETNIFKNLSNI
jgi:hypothetical protein